MAETAEEAGSFQKNAGGGEKQVVLLGTATRAPVWERKMPRDVTEGFIIVERRTYDHLYGRGRGYVFGIEVVDNCGDRFRVGNTSKLIQ